MRPSSHRLAIALSSSLVFLVGATAFAETQLQFFTWTGGHSAQLENDVLDMYRRAHPDVKLDYLTASGGTTGLYQRLQILAASGTAADLTATHTNWSRQAAEQGLLLDLRPYIKRDHIDLSRFPKGVLDAYRGPHGELYGLPWQFTTMVLGYNKSYFDRAGVTHPSADWSIFDMTDAAKKLRVDSDGDGDPESWGLGETMLNDYVWRLWGLPYVSDDGRRSGWHQDQNAAIEAWDWYGKLYVQGIMRGYSASLWSGGKMAMYLGWPHNLANAAPSMADAWDVEVMPLPAHGDRVARAAGAGWSILSSSTHPDEAWEVLKTLISPEAQYRLLITGRGGISRDALIRYWVTDFDPSALGIKSSATLQNRQVMITAYEYASLDNTPPDYARYISEVNSPLSKSMRSGQESAATAVPKAIAQIDGMLAESLEAQ